MRTWFSQRRQTPQRRGKRSGRYRPALEQLESRCLLAAPVIDPITNVTANIPDFGTTGKTIFIPVTASATGNPLTYSISGNTDPADISATVLTGETFLRLTVAGFGDLEFELFNTLTPDTVNVISGLVKSGFYNGLTIHRVSKNFVIQAGDPNGDGSGGPGFEFDDEYNASAIYSGNGQLAMANAGNDTNGSQFFVTVNNQPRFLDFTKTIFGQLVRGFDVLNAINQVPITPVLGPTDGKPITPIVITNASIVQDVHDAVLMLTAKSSSGSGIITVKADDGLGGVATQSFTANIINDTTNDPAFLNPVSNQSTPQNTAITFPVSGTDLEGNPMTFTATLMGPNSSKATATVAGNMITVTPTDATFVGPLQLQIGVTEAGQSTPDTETIVVAVGPRTITSPTAVDVTATAGISTGSVTVATFTDSNASATAADYTALINWGDDHLTVGTITNNASSFTVTGANTYLHPGTYPVKVTIQLNASLGGNVATVTGTATVVKEQLIAVGADAGGGPEVKVFNAVTGDLVFDFNAYDPTFRGGVRVAVGDVNNDGIPDIITAPGLNGGMLIKVFSGKDLTLLNAFDAAYPTDQFGHVFEGGLFVAAGDMNNDGFADIMVTPDATGGPLVHVYSGKLLTQGMQALPSLLIAFNALDVSNGVFSGGLHIAAGDVNEDGFADIIVSAATGSSEVKVFDGRRIVNTPPLSALIRDFLAYDQGTANGVYIAAGDVNGDGIADIMTGPNANNASLVKVFNGVSTALITEVFAFDSTFTGGVRVAAVDANGDGRADIVAGAGPTGATNLKVFDSVSLAVLDNLFAFNSGFQGGIQVGGA